MIRKRDPEAIRPYLEDASGMRGGAADEVALPESADEAAEMLTSASADGTAVTVSGGGTGLAGGRIPRGGRVLATDRLGGVRGVRRERAGGVLVAGPAATLGDIDAAAAEHGLFLPPDPTETLAWIGGAVGTNASGSRTFHYGPLRRWVRRLQVVLADGSVLDAPRGRFRADASGRLLLPGRRGERPVPVPPRPAGAVKSATGYAGGPGLDLVDLIAGSEGTLGLVTEVELELLPRPENVLTGVAFFGSEKDCLDAVEAIRERSYAARGHRGPAPSAAGTPAPRPAGGVLWARALEFFGDDALQFVRQAGRSVPDGARAGLLFEQEHGGRDEEAVLSAWLGVLEEHAALVDDSWIAPDEAARRAIRDFRHALPEGINEWLSRHGRTKHGTDIAVPDAALREMFAGYRRDIEDSGMPSVIFGHVGDNHLHVNLLPSDDEEERRAWEVLRGWVRRGVALGGVPSAEHGIGKLKAPLLAEVLDPGYLASMRATKAALDPAGILGPGTLLAGDRDA